MSTFRVPLVWQMYGYLDVEANTLQEAIDYALGPEAPLPEGNYLDDSVAIDDIIVELNNHSAVSAPSPDNGQDHTAEPQLEDDFPF